MKIQTICSILFSRFVTIVFHLLHGGLQHETKPHVTVRLVWISALDSLVGWAPDYIFRGPGAQIRIVVWSIIVSPIPFHFVPWPTPGNDRLISHSRGRFWGDLWWRKSFKEGEMWILAPDSSDGRVSDYRVSGSLGSNPSTVHDYFNILYTQNTSLATFKIYSSNGTVHWYTCTSSTRFATPLLPFCAQITVFSCLKLHAL